MKLRFLSFLFFLSAINLPAQITYKIFTSSDGETLYRYSDGYTLTKKDFDESERLRSSSDKKYGLQDFDGALQEAEQAVSLNKNNHLAWTNRGLAKFGKKNFDGAIADYTEAIRIKPDYHVAWYNRGLAKQSKGNFSAAIIDYTEAIRLKPDYYLAWTGRGYSKTELKDLDGAIADYNEAIRLKPDHAIPWNNRGWVKEQKGQLEAAREDYKKAMALDPNYETPKNNLARVEGKLASRRPSTVHLVSVGIGNYQQDYAFNDLEFTVSGAHLVRNLFERRHLTAPGRPLIQSAARRQNIISALESLTDPAKVAENDMVVFYFSGHGLLAGGKVGICPYDYQSPADLISDEQIASILSRSPARHKVCLIEACKSEKSADYLDPSAVARFNQQRRNISPGIVFITSTEVGRKSWGGTEGYFTQAILEALSEGKADSNGDRVITVLEFFTYLQPIVKSRTNNEQIPQINTGYPKDLPLMQLGN